MYRVISSQPNRRPIDGNINQSFTSLSSSRLNLRHEPCVLLLGTVPEPCYAKGMRVGDQFCLVGNTDEAEADTVEMQLSPDEILSLTTLQEECSTSSIDRPALPAPSAVPAVRNGFRLPNVTRDPKPPSVWRATAPGLSLAVLVGAWAIQFTSPQPAAVNKVTANATPLPAARASPPLPAPSVAAPVRFANPFDASEVFEFPAGTSATEAHDAVADILLQRARERVVLMSKTKRLLRADMHTPKASQQTALDTLDSKYPQVAVE